MYISADINLILRDNLETKYLHTLKGLLLLVYFFLQIFVKNSTEAHLLVVPLGTTTVLNKVAMI